jgi:ABC-2 type transport system permease protein
MLVALPALLAVFGIGRMVMHVQLRATQWLAVVGLSWFALMPFALLGIVIGYLATADSVQPITSGLFFLLSLLGGLWFPVDQLPRVMQRIAEATPSYWLAALARSPLTHGSSYARAGLALAAWTVGLAVLAARRFCADTARG